MNERLLEQAEKLASRNYMVSVYEDKLSDGTTIYMAKNPELSGCMAQGETIEDAINNLRDARIDYIYDSLEDGISVPDPASHPQPLPRITKTTDTSNTGRIVITDSVSFVRTADDQEQLAHRKQLYEAWIGT